jgi:hypothetical protein
VLVGLVSTKDCIAYLHSKYTSRILRAAYKIIKDAMKVASDFFPNNAKEASLSINHDHSGTSIVTKRPFAIDIVPLPLLLLPGPIYIPLSPASITLDLREYAD